MLGAGHLLHEVIAVAKHLAEEGVESMVLNMHSVKPMDIDTVKRVASETGAVVSVEEHQILGGVGGTIAEIFAQNTPIPMEMVAVHDRFGQVGTREELLHAYHMDVQAIREAVYRVLLRKR
jgi:transketolase